MATQILDVDPVFERAWHRAGEAAELECVAWLRKNAKGAEVFHSKRIARGAGAGRYEIDVILLTPTQLTVIEVKNWSGPIVERGGLWAKHREDGSRLSQDNPVPKTALKLEALERFCLARNVPLPPWMSTAVLLWNEQARPDPAILRHPAVVLKGNVDCLLPPKGARGGLTRAQMRSLAQTLDAAEGFDTVTFYGGRKLQGDLLRVVTGQKRSSFEALPRGQTVRVQVPRGAFWVRAKAILGFGPMMRFDGALKDIAITPRDRLLFHPAGEVAPIEIPLAALRSLRKG